MEYKCLCDRIDAALSKPRKDADGNEIVETQFKDGQHEKTRTNWFAWFAWYPARLEDGVCIWWEKVYRQDTRWTEYHYSGSDNYSISGYRRHE